MSMRQSTVRIPVTKKRLKNPIDRWKKENGKTNREMAELLGYSTIDGYHRLARYAAMPIEKLQAFAQLSGQSLEELIADYQKHMRGAR
jgi:hypothetical protein